MAQTTKVGIIGAGWPGRKHAEGYQAAGGFAVVAVADLIPSRAGQLHGPIQSRRGEYADAERADRDKEVDVVSLCLPNHLHLPIALAALKAGKHVVCEMPPALTAAEAKTHRRRRRKGGEDCCFTLRSAASAETSRPPGRRSTRATPATSCTPGHPGPAPAACPSGTGWYADRAKSGGGAMIDLGLHMLDLAWSLLGQPKPLSSSRPSPP